METEVLTEIASGNAGLSIWRLIWSADLVIKLVMFGLVAASVWTWAIILEKVGSLRYLKKTHQKI